MKRNYLLISLLSFILINCSKKDDGPGSPDHVASSENAVISFKIPGNGEEYSGVIDQANKTIQVTVTNLDLSNPITPIIEISKNATISPSASVAQNFDEDVQYTVTAENGDKAIYNIKVTSSDNQITSFGITPYQTTFYGEIDEVNKTITIETTGLELNSTLIPTIEYSHNATISPDPSIAQDFSKDIEYTLTAQNGEVATYMVKTKNTATTNLKKILSFQFKFGSKIYDGVIDHNNLTIVIETNKPIHNLEPLITISNNASISPNPNEPQNFYQDVEYTVTAEDNTYNTYTVKAKSYEIHDMQTTKFYSTGVGVLNGNGLDLTVPNSSLVLENDTDSFTLNVIDSYIVVQPSGNVSTRHSFSFPENIITARNYRIKYKINNETKVMSGYVIDVLAEDVPVINTTNQTVYKFGDTLILYGENLVPGLDVYAVRGNIYRYGEQYLSVNNDKTELTLPLTVNDKMFPSYYGQTENYDTRLTIYYNGRLGPSYVVEFD